jgi:hypothetical protein
MTSFLSRVNNHQKASKLAKKPCKISCNLSTEGMSKKPCLALGFYLTCTATTLIKHYFIFIYMSRIVVAIKNEKTITKIS